MLNKKAFRPVLIAAGCVVLALILCAVFLRDATMAVIDLDGDVAVIPGSAENPDYTKEEVAALLQKSLEGRFETVSCSYDEAHYVYTVYLTRAGMAVTAVQAADGNKTALDAWNRSVESLQTINGALQKAVDTLSPRDLVMIYLLNDQTPENALLVMLNSKVLTSVV